MVINHLSLATLAAALATGLAAGTFFAFSSFVMRALGRLEPATGVAAMQSINVAVINPLFMTVLFGAAVLLCGLLLIAMQDLTAPGAVWLLAGALLYVVGAIAVTMLLNVPLNNRLAVLDPASSEAARFWPIYLRDWTIWNSVRAFASCAASAALIMSYSAQT